MQTLGINEKDLEEQFVRGSGPGGQKRNVTASLVILKHLPSQTIIKCDKTRSQADNRFFARRMLCERLSNAKSPSTLANEKIIKQKKRRKRRAKIRIEEKNGAPRKE